MLQGDSLFVQNNSQDIIYRAGKRERLSTEESRKRIVIENKSRHSLHMNVVKGNLYKIINITNVIMYPFLALGEKCSTCRHQDNLNFIVNNVPVSSYIMMNPFSIFRKKTS